MILLFNPEISINSGQMFLWEKFRDSWYGIYRNNVLQMSVIKEIPKYLNEKCIYEYIHFDSYPKFDNWEKSVFRLDDDINKIFTELSNDATIFDLLNKYSGLRLMRQDPFQCMISFACSSNTNIPMIRNMLKKLSRKFGTKLYLNEKEFYTFPTVKSLSNSTIDELCSCGVGYRAKTIKSIVDAISKKSLDIDYLCNCNYDEAKSQLTSIYGIGNKIADCIMLFSLEKIDAFPIDVWISRSLFLYYQNLFNCLISHKNKISINQYNLISNIVKKYFGRYSGYAQQYLYYHIRHISEKKW